MKAKSPQKISKKGEDERPFAVTVSGVR